MLKNYIQGILVLAQANLVLFQAAAKKWLFQMLGLLFAAILLDILGISFKNAHIVFLGSLVSSVIFILSYWTAVVLNETVIGTAKMIPVKGKDEAKKRDEAVEKIAVGLNRMSCIFLTTALILSFVSTWSIAFGFSSFKLGIVEMATMVVITFSVINFYKRKEAVWPQWIIGTLTVIAAICYFSTLDTAPSRAIAVRLHNLTIGTEKNSDSKATAVIISDAILYHVDEDGDLVEWTNYPGAKLVIGSVVRIKETRRFDDELFTKVVIPNANGSYARGTKAYIQTEVLSSSKGLTVYPNATNPQYAISKEKSGSLILGGKEVWKIYFLTNEPIDFESMPGKWYTLSGINSGELWAMNSRTDNLQAGKMGNDLKVGVKYHNTTARAILAAPKGTVLIITWTNS